MATVFDQIEELKIAPNPKKSGRKFVPLIGGVVVGLVLGYLGWILPIPGGSFLIPTLIVAGAGVLVTLVGAVFALHPNHHSLRVFCITVLVLTIAASIWTYAFSMPASVAWDTNATHEAQVVLARVDAEPKTNTGIPIKACWTVRQGSIGSPSPLQRMRCVHTRGSFRHLYAHWLQRGTRLHRSRRSNISRCVLSTPHRRVVGLPK